MLPIALHAAISDEFEVARPFFYGGIVLTGLCVLTGISARNWRVRKPARAMLLTVIGTYLALPVLLALPLMEAVPDLTLLDGYFEMMSSLTTTGATIIPDPASVADSVHLWRALVAWLGGLLIWVSAIAILAPLRLGGFEVLPSRVVHSQTGPENVDGQDPRERLARHVADLSPIYFGLTFMLWVLLLLAGEDPFVALCHAMSTLATSGITPTGGFEDGSAGRLGEAFVAVFLVFALSRRSFARDMSSSLRLPLRREPELRAAAFIVVSLTVVLVLRHWLAQLESPEDNLIIGVLSVAWGAFFTSFSFLTTNGFVSADWATTEVWTGLSAPGLILMGLALVGGGVATTAGGVKLLRVYILYKHGAREMERLVHPSSVSHLGSRERPILHQNAVIAWVYFMTFGIALCATILLLTATGIDFERSAVFAVAALSTTGPVIDRRDRKPHPIDLVQLPDLGKLVLCVAMATWAVRNLDARGVAQSRLLASLIFGAVLVGINAATREIKSRIDAAAPGNMLQPTSYCVPRVKRVAAKKRQ